MKCLNNLVSQEMPHLGFISNLFVSHNESYLLMSHQIMNLVVLQIVMAPIMEVFGIGMIQFIRHNEFEADRFAVQIGESYL